MNLKMIMPFFFLVFAQEDVVVNFSHDSRNRKKQSIQRQFFMTLGYQTPDEPWLKYNVWNSYGKLPRW